MSPESYKGSSEMFELAYELKPHLIASEEKAQAAAAASRIKSQRSNEQTIGKPIHKNAVVENLINTRIESTTTIISPDDLNYYLPLSEKSARTTIDSRQAGENIIKGLDDRLIVIVGPCSIHDIDSGLQYANYVKNWRSQFGDDLEIIMRYYVEKPRTVTGWKGFTYDPKLTEFFNPAYPDPDINLGLILSRMLGIQITNSGVPVAMERLNASTPQYVNGLIAADTIGARNAEDQTAREYMSGTSSFGSIKNLTDGSVDGAIDAIVSASSPHVFLGLNLNGNLVEVRTTGNDSCILLLRGGRDKPNYYDADVKNAVKKLEERSLKLGHKLNIAIGVDTSHMNSGKDHKEQMSVARDIKNQLSAGQVALKMVMIESNLVAGSQTADGKTTIKDLVAGQSITDSCINTGDTGDILGMLANGVRERRKHYSV